GADLDELRGLLHEVGFRDAGADGQHPAGIAHASRVGDCALVVTVAGQSQGDGDAVGGQDGLQMGADVAVQPIETVGEELMACSSQKLAISRVEKSLRELPASRPMAAPFSSRISTICCNNWRSRELAPICTTGGTKTGS